LSPLSREQKDKEAILKYLPLVKSIAYRIYKHLPVARSLDLGSKSLRRREKEIKAKLEELTNQLGREPTDEELIKALGYKSDDFYSDLQKISASHFLSLDDLFKEGRSYEEVFPPRWKRARKRTQ
jgi:DNA-directed RNA polymerase specialized sigma subunit